MKTQMYFFLVVGLMVVLLSSSVLAQQRQLFTVASDAVDVLNKDPDKQKIYNNLLVKALKGKVTLLKFDKNTLSHSEIQIEIGNREAVFVLDELDLRGENDFSWHGRAKNGLGTIVLVFFNGQLAGNVIYKDKSYSISPFGEKMVAFYEINSKSFPRDHPQSANNYTDVYEMNYYSNLNAGAVTLRVLVAYTYAAQVGASGLGYFDMKLFIQQAVSETNQSFINSNVAHRVKLAAAVRVNYSESGSFSTDLARFQSTNDGHMDEIHTDRNNYSADVSVLIINNSSACGLASGIGSNASSAFSAVHFDCTLGYYSFAHEIAHLHGCRHNPEADPSNSPYPYGHGYYNTTGNWRTIMSYECPGGCTRIQYWSNPDISYGGAVMGTVSTHDNARVLDETAPTLAAFRTAPSNLVLTSSSSLIANEIGNAIATSSITLNPGFQVSLDSEFHANAYPSAASDALYANISLSPELNAMENDLSEENMLFNIFPNPNSGSFEIRLQDLNSSSTEVVILDTFGKEIYKSIQSSQGKLRVNLQADRPGMYFVRFKNENGTITKKVYIGI